MLYPNLSLKLRKCPYPVETQQSCSDSDPQSGQSSNMPEISKKNSFYPGARSLLVTDGRITHGKNIHKNILIHMTNIGKKFPEPTIRILEYFFQSIKIAKNMLELSLIKVTSRNNWLKRALFIR